MIATEGNAKEMICISCPIGCRLTVTQDDDRDVVVEGNKCARGKVYGEEEYLAPKRMVTCTCRTDSEEFPRVPVRTIAPIPIECIDGLLRDLYDMTVSLPVSRGHLLIENYRETGVDVIATMSLKNQE